MSHCACRSVNGAAPVSAETTVEEIKRRPGALDVLHGLGINHCCGAHLPLREAAAAAGVPVEKVLEALGDVLDVRGLEPPQPLVAVLKRLESMAPGETLTVIHDRRPLLLYPQLDARGFTHRTDEPEPGVVRIVIRRAAS